MEDALKAQKVQYDVVRCVGDGVARRGDQPGRFGRAKRTAEWGARGAAPRMVALGPTPPHPAGTPAPNPLPPPRRWDSKASPAPSIKSIVYDGTKPKYRGVAIIPNLEGNGAMKKADVRPSGGGDGGRQTTG
jgi:hypothetical protein